MHFVDGGVLPRIAFDELASGFLDDVDVWEKSARDAFEHSPSLTRSRERCEPGSAKHAKQQVNQPDRHKYDDEHADDLADVWIERREAVNAPEDHATNQEHYEDLEEHGGEHAC